MKSTLSFCTLILISGCEHQEVQKELIPEASIEFFSPSPGFTYRHGDTVHVTATGISTAAIHGYDLSITRPGDTSYFYFHHIHDHNDTVHINEKWKNTLNTHASMLITISLYLDHAGNTETATRSFTTE
jgi:hypothetical protein